MSVWPNAQNQKRKSLSLIPNGTLQFADIDLDFTGIKRIETEFAEEEIPHFVDGQSNWKLHCLKSTEQGYVDVQTEERFTGRNVYSVSVDKALESFSGKWVPLPFFRRADNINRHILPVHTIVIDKLGTPYGNRTRVTAVRGRRPDR